MSEVHSFLCYQVTSSSTGFFNFDMIAFRAVQFSGIGCLMHGKQCARYQYHMLLPSVELWPIKMSPDSAKCSGQWEMVYKIASS